MRFLFLALMITLFLGVYRAGAEELPPQAQTLVNAELEFAQAAKDSSTREAFLAFLADDGILFEPKPVLGLLHYRSQPETADLLSWIPVYTEISASGDLGLTTGPWEYFKTRRDEKPVSFGHYVSLWRLQPGGGWRVVLDLGNVHERMTSPPPPMSFRVNESDIPERKWDSIDIGEERSGLREMDAAFSELCGAEGVSAAYSEFSDADLRVYRMGSTPVLGLDSVLEHLSGVMDGWFFSPEASEVSRSADLGYTYGTARLDGSESSYVHVWRKVDGSWRLALDILIPVTPPKK